MEISPEKTIKKPSAAVIGGSIAGLSSAHALLHAGWAVTVIERAPSPPRSSSTGAGLGLDPQSLSILRTWTKPHLPTLPLSTDMNSRVNGDSKERSAVAIDEGFGFRAAHWSDLHLVLLESLPEGSGAVWWGHEFVGVVGSHDSSPVRIGVRVVASGETVEMTVDLVVAADGSLSAVRRSFLPEHRLRYSGYCAWRGVLKFSEDERAEGIVSDLRRAYPELGRCLYFDLASDTHSVLYELHNKRVNWIWYVNQLEPQLEGKSVTTKATDDMIKNMHEEAKEVWVPELAEVMKQTKDPFINAIYDSEPLPQLFFGSVVLVGDAAHPTTPHGLRSTNMSIVDAKVLAGCIAKWGVERLTSALEEYQVIRLPVVSKQVLHARRLGQIKQGLAVDDGVVFDPVNVRNDEQYDFLLQRSMPFFGCAPVSI